MCGGEVLRARAAAEEAPRGSAGRPALPRTLHYSAHPLPRHNPASTPSSAATAEILIAGELQEPSKRAVARAVEAQDRLVESAKEGEGLTDGEGAAMV